MISKTLIKTLSITLFSAYFTYALNFLGQVIIARILLPEHFGTLAIVLAIKEILAIFVGLSISMAYIQEKESETLFYSACTLSLIVGFIPIILSIIIFYPLNLFYESKIAIYVILISLNTPLVFLGTILTAKLEKKMFFFKSYLFSALASLITLTITIFLAYYGFEEKSLIAREFLFGILLFLILKIFIKQKIKFQFKIEEVKKLFNYSLNQLFSRGAEIAYFKIPFLLIGTIYGEVNLGYFYQAFIFTSMLVHISSPITQKAMFVFYSNNKNLDINSNKIFHITNMIIIFIFIPICLIIFFYSEEIVKIIYGQKWLSAAFYLKYLVIYAVFISIYNNYKSYFYSFASNNFITLSYLLSLVVAIIIISIGKLEYVYSFSIFIGLSFVMILKKYVKNKKN